MFSLGNLKKAYLLTNVERDRVIRKFMMQTALNKVSTIWGNNVSESVY